MYHFVREILFKANTMSIVSDHVLPLHYQIIMYAIIIIAIIVIITSTNISIITSPAVMTPVVY